MYTTHTHTTHARARTHTHTHTHTFDFLGEKKTSQLSPLLKSVTLTAVKMHMMSDWYAASSVMRRDFFSEKGIGLFECDVIHLLNRKNH